MARSLYASRPPLWIPQALPAFSRWQRLTRSLARLRPDSLLARTLVVFYVAAALLPIHDTSAYAALRVALAVLAGAGVLLVLVLMSRRISRSVSALERAAERWSQGDWKVRVGLQPDDEFGQLARALERMADHRARAELGARAAADQLSAVLAAATEYSIIGTDLHGTITVFNAGAERLLGWRADEVIGRVSPVLFHDRDELETRATALGVKADFEALTIAARAGEAETREWTYLRKDGSRLTVSLTVTGMLSRDGALRGFIGIASDVTKRRAVDRMKDEFVSVVSHELRTPLTSIRGSLGLMAAGLLSAAPERSQRMLEIAVENTDRLIRLINDILDIERIESGRVAMQKTVCSVADLVTQAVEIMRPVAERAGVTLEVSGGQSGRLYADADRTIQVLTNLLSNAIKFSPAGCSVQIEAESTSREVLILVRDHGRGIPHDQLLTIFDRFQQVDASDSREKGGTGLGLAICRTIVEQHGGSIWAESEPGQGATLVVALPVTAEARRAAADTPRGAGLPVQA